MVSCLMDEKINIGTGDDVLIPERRPIPIIACLSWILGRVLVASIYQRLPGTGRYLGSL